MGERPKKQVCTRRDEDGHAWMELSQFSRLKGSWVGYHPCPEKADTVLQRWQVRGILATILPSRVHDRHH